MPALVVVPIPSSAAALPADFPVECDAHGFEHGLLPSDCITAIDNLPTDQPGDIHMDLDRHEMIYPEFSVYAGQDRHRLPISEEVGTCGVEVRFKAPSVADRSSWRIIRLRLMDVYRNCVDAGTGGSTTTGQKKQMELVLYSTSNLSDLSLVVSNNMTLVV